MLFQCLCGFEPICYFTQADDEPYLVAFLNSKLSKYYFSKIATTTGVGTVRWLKYKVELLPVPLLNNVDQSLSGKIKEASNSNKISDKMINDTIYKIFNLNDNEISYIESYN